MLKKVTLIILILISFSLNAMNDIQGSNPYENQISKVKPLTTITTAYILKNIGKPGLYKKDIEALEDDAKKITRNYILNYEYPKFLNTYFKESKENPIKYAMLPYIEVAQGVTSIDFHPSGKYFFTSTGGSELKVWDLFGSLIGDVDHIDKIDGFCFSNKGKHFLTWSYRVEKDNVKILIKLWDMEGNLLMTLDERCFESNRIPLSIEGCPLELYNICFSQEDKHICTYQHFICGKIAHYRTAVWDLQGNFIKSFNHIIDYLTEEDEVGCISWEEDLRQCRIANRGFINYLEGRGTLVDGEGNHIHCYKKKICRGDFILTLSKSSGGKVRLWNTRLNKKLISKKGTQSYIRLENLTTEELIFLIYSRLTQERRLYLEATNKNGKIKFHQPQQSLPSNSCIIL